MGVFEGKGLEKEVKAIKNPEAFSASGFGLFDRKLETREP
jgi:hypothetical protein